MTPDDIGRLSRAARQAGVTQLELVEDGCSLTLRLSGRAPHPPVQAGSPESPASTPAGKAPVTAPTIGLFHHRHPLTGRSASEPGQRVTKGQVVGFLVVGSCVLPVTVPADGAIGAPVHADGAVVGYGAPLYPMG